MRLGTVAVRRGTFSITCEPRVTGQRGGWMTFESGPVRYRVGGVRVPRWVFRVLLRAAMRP